MLILFLFGCFVLVSVTVRSIEMMREKEEKRRLEERITKLQGQMLMGGIPAAEMANTPGKGTTYLVLELQQCFSIFSS